MVFHMVFIANGIALSEMILITEKGAERITKLERKLFWNT